MTPELYLLLFATAILQRAAESLDKDQQTIALLKAN